MAPLRTAVLSAFCALLSVGIASPAQSHTESVRRSIARRTNGNGTCPIPTDIPVRASKESPFLPLTNEDFGSVVDWLFQPEQNLNLTSVSNENLTQTDNYIWLIEALHPNKTDILNYLDRNSTKPRKYARVVINEGGKEIPDATEYFVGPLPIDNTTTIKTLDYIYTSSPHIPFNARFEDGPRSTAIDSIVAKTMSSIADITKDLMEIEYYGQSDERSNCQYFVSKPSSGNGSQSIVWLPWRLNGIAPYDQMMDFYASFDISGTDESLYTFRMFVYNNVVYTSVQQFREAWESGKIIKSPVTPLDESHLRKDRIGDFRELETRFAPTTVELDGKRYKVDEENRYVEYLGWSFYTGFTRDVGIQFFDIKFKGERVIYELSLQDAVAQYAGNNPFQAGTAYNDRFYGIGALMGRLIPGYDCPYHATYWNSTIHGAESTNTNINSICIFETDIGHPITRHSAETYKQATKGSALVVRVVATVGNYDYLWDYTFMTDGAIGDHWGPRIAETITGTLHTHVMNFKVDFDIIDDKNSFVKTDLIIENITQPWYPERGTFEMARLNFTELQTEDEGLLPSTVANGQTMYTIQNNAHKNKWGVPRGYRIVPGVSNVHLPSMLSPWFLKSGQYAKQAMAVSRQHDTEPYSSAALNQNLPEAPLVEFWSFFNGESLRQEDLVVWVNLGMHHYTRSEDLPNTLMSEAHSSVVFAPQNWGDVEGTRDLANAVIYNRGEGDIAGPFTNGVNPPSCFALGPEDELLGVFENGSA
ncbi:copper amine oxidase [Leptodontidium sp. MPI-SDFR-AT-0119]|nr:copper amine oxidase [Leptodontidium sp. MPI-SDFR-AT-0119]